VVSLSAGAEESVWVSGTLVSVWAWSSPGLMRAMATVPVGVLGEVAWPVEAGRQGSAQMAIKEG